MSIPQQKKYFVSWFVETKCYTHTLRNYRINKEKKIPPLCPSICAWHKKFMEPGTNFNKERSGHAIAIIDDDMLQKTWRTIEQPLDVFCAANGVNTKVY
ncbi:hypothetical protein AVEN_89218-1 [Araneus ventricosus]|uniref:Uncharacterized protein n=1 Tax=Araneus ventricosus TaxID=182803 RepID=A0A4Y2AIY1_ARAVE|nr:hypothetical protein AVEN_89218-1 [Araneus ventricosus]